MTRRRLLPVPLGYAFGLMLALVLALALLACGPTADAPASVSDDTRASAQEEPTPTQGPPAVEPTETPKPPLPEPPTPKPEPTRPLSTSVPTPVPGPTEEFRPELLMQPHPNGLEGCRTLNRFASLDEDEVYRPWCSLAAGEDVRTHCSGAETAQAAKQCAYQRLADFKDYTIRNLITPCLGIANEDDRNTCIAETWEAFWEHQEDLISVWNEVVAAVDAHPDVKDHFWAMAECVREQGYEAPDPDYPLSWQQIDKTKVEVRPDRGSDATDAEKRAETARLRVVNSCGLDTEFFQSQDTAWQEEIWRIFHSETPERIGPLKEEGIIDILEEPGPALFLTIQDFDYR